LFSKYLATAVLVKPHQLAAKESVVGRFDETSSTKPHLRGKLLVGEDDLL
jgi:hypothetical protein